MTTIREAADLIRKLPGVTGVRIWDKVPGKARVYVGTQSFNGTYRNQGCGLGECFVEETGRVVIGAAIGGRTDKAHREMGTESSLREIAAMWAAK